MVLLETLQVTACSFPAVVFSPGHGIVWTRAASGMGGDSPPLLECSPTEKSKTNISVVPHHCCRQRFLLFLTAQTVKEGAWWAKIEEQAEVMVQQCTFPPPPISSCLPLRCCCLPLTLPTPVKLDRSWKGRACWEGFQPTLPGVCNQGVSAAAWHLRQRKEACGGDGLPPCSCPPGLLAGSAERRRATVAVEHSSATAISCSQDPGGRGGPPLP